MLLYNIFGLRQADSISSSEFILVARNLVELGEQLFLVLRSDSPAIVFHGNGEYLLLCLHCHRHFHLLVRVFQGVLQQVPYDVVYVHLVGRYGEALRQLIYDMDMFVFLRIEKCQFLFVFLH